MKKMNGKCVENMCNLLVFVCHFVRKCVLNLGFFSKVHLLNWNKKVG